MATHPCDKTAFEFQRFAYRFVRFWTGQAFRHHRGLAVASGNTQCIYEGVAAVKATRDRCIRVLKAHAALCGYPTGFVNLQLSTGMLEGATKWPGA